MVLRIRHAFEQWTGKRLSGQGFERKVAKVGVQRLHSASWFRWSSCQGVVGAGCGDGVIMSK
jgi:hypothetical protein